MNLPFLTPSLKNLFPAFVTDESITHSQLQDFFLSPMTLQKTLSMMQVIVLS